MTFPGRDVAVHQDIGGAVCGEFCHFDSDHVRTVSEAIREEEDVGFSSGRGWQGLKLDREYRPANCLAGGFTRLTLQATVYPPFRAGFHANPPVKAL